MSNYQPSFNAVLDLHTDTLIVVQTSFSTSNQHDVMDLQNEGLFFLIQVAVQTIIERFFAELPNEKNILTAPCHYQSITFYSFNHRLILIRVSKGVLELIPAVVRQEAGILCGRVTHTCHLKIYTQGQFPVSNYVHVLDCGRNPACEKP